MGQSRFVVRTLVVLLLAALATACGGKTIMTADGVTVESSANGCIDIEVSSAALTCTTDQDCTVALVGPGTVCPGAGTGCGGFPMNNAAAALVNAEARPLLTGISFPCPNIPNVSLRCFRGQCTDCVGDPGESEGCYVATADGGTVTVDAGEFDSGAGTTDGGESDGSVDTIDATEDAGKACVDIDLSTYDTLCVENIDCITIQSGEVCSGSCDCGGSPVSASEQARYDRATSGIVFAACPCASGGLLECIAGTCVICGYGPNQPAGCPDAG